MRFVWWERRGFGAQVRRREERRVKVPRQGEGRAEWEALTHAALYHPCAAGAGGQSVRAAPILSQDQENGRGEGRRQGELDTYPPTNVDFSPSRAVGWWCDSIVSCNVSSRRAYYAFFRCVHLKPSAGCRLLDTLHSDCSERVHAQCFVKPCTVTPCFVSMFMEAPCFAKASSSVSRFVKMRAIAPGFVKYYVMAPGSSNLMS